MREHKFDLDDLFVTVRDSALRAYNRLRFIENNYADFPKLKKLYLASVRDADTRAMEEIAAIKRMIRTRGLTPVQVALKYRINPYEEV